MKHLTFLSLILVFCCSSCSLMYTKSYNCVSETVERQSKVFEARNEMFLISYSGDWRQNIKEIELFYFCFQELDVPGVRKIYVECMESILDDINNNPKIHPYLSEHPFTWRNIDLTISFHNSSKSGKVPRNKIASAFMAKGILFYNINHESLNKLDDFYEEPYEEALRIVNAERGRF